MKNLSLSSKIILVNIILSVLVAIGYQLTETHTAADEFAFAIGIAALLLSMVNLFIGLILLFTGYKQWRNGFLITGAVMLLFSGITCGAGAGL